MSTDSLLQRAKALRLNGLAENWQDVQDFTWVKQLIEWEEVYRSAGQRNVTEVPLKNGCNWIF